MARRPEEIFLFVNPKSGGNKGEIFMQAPQPFLVDVGEKKVSLRIYSLLDGKSGDKEGFKQLKKALSFSSTPIRTIVGGGDGTITWVDSEVTKHGIDHTRILYGIVPLGTGNDFARVAGWGGKNPQNLQRNEWFLLKHLVKKWCEADPRLHDMWEVTLGVDDTHGEILKVNGDKAESPIEETELVMPMINYFSIGQESKVGMDFDMHRTKSQTCNLFVYACSGVSQELRCCSTQHISSIVSTLHLGTDSDGRVLLDSTGAGGPRLVGNPESLLFLNVNSYAGGNAHFWQKESDCGVRPDPPDEDVDVDEDPGDGRLEVVTLPSIVGIPLDKLVHAAKRVHSGGPYYMEFYTDDRNDVDAYVEVDGEFFHLVNPESVTITLKKKLWVLQNMSIEHEESWIEKLPGEVMKQAEKLQESLSPKNLTPLVSGAAKGLRGLTVQFK